MATLQSPNMSLAAGEHAVRRIGESDLNWALAEGWRDFSDKRGDIIFHDAYLWHSAARGTDDETRRRHVRGGWYSGGGALETEHLEDFVKNAAR